MGDFICYYGSFFFAHNRIGKNGYFNEIITAHEFKYPDGRIQKKVVGVNGLIPAYTYDDGHLNDKTPGLLPLYEAVIGLSEE